LEPERRKALKEAHRQKVLQTLNDRLKVGQLC
jgi:hypothetical protein